MICYTHDKNGWHYIGMLRGDGSVARSEEVYAGEDGSWVVLDYGHDGKLIGVDIRMEDEETPCCAGGCTCEESGEEVTSESCECCGLASDDGTPVPFQVG